MLEIVKNKQKNENIFFNFSLRCVAQITDSPLAYCNLRNATVAFFIKGKNH